MTPHSDNDSELYSLLAAALAQAVPDLTKSIPGTTFYGTAIEMAAAIRSRTYLKRSVLLDLVRVRPTEESPVQPTRKLMAAHAHGNERPAARGI